MMIKLIRFFLLMGIFNSCSEQNTPDLYVEITNCNRLSTNIKVLQGDSEIGIVKEVRPKGQNMIAEIELIDGIQIPKGSIFDLREDILDYQQIVVTFKNNELFYKKGDTILANILPKYTIDETIDIDSMLKVNKVDSLLKLH